MLDLDWMKDTLKEAIENEEWDLVREVIAYLSDDDSVTEESNGSKDFFSSIHPYWTYKLYCRSGL